MPTLLLTFANSDTNRLKTLTDEYEGVSDALRGREVQGDFTVVAKPIATRDQIYKEIRAREADISLFLFSGHAGADRVLLEDGDGHSEGIAGLLGRCPNVKVVILNGCSTGGQVDLLLSQKVPIVIATSSPVGDETATKFSIALFNELSQQRLPIGEAFDRAIVAAKVTGEIKQVDRGYRSLETTKDDEPLWGLFFQEKDRELITTWHLPKKPVHRVDGTEGVNDQLQGALVQIAMDNGITPTDATLDRLPYMIHHPIRKLLTPEGQGAFPFYDKPSWERFQMLLYAYRSIINLTTYALLAEAWEQIFKSPDDYKRVHFKLSLNVLSLEHD